MFEELVKKFHVKYGKLQIQGYHGLAADPRKKASPGSFSRFSQNPSSKRAAVNGSNNSNNANNNYAARTKFAEKYGYGAGASEQFAGPGNEANQDEHAASELDQPSAGQEHDMALPEINIKQSNQGHGGNSRGGGAASGSNFVGPSGAQANLLSSKLMHEQQRQPSNAMGNEADDQNQQALDGQPRPRNNQNAAYQGEEMTAEQEGMQREMVQKAGAYQLPGASLDSGLNSQRQQPGQQAANAKDGQGEGHLLRASHQTQNKTDSYSNQDYDEEVPQQEAGSSAQVRLSQGNSREAEEVALAKAHEMLLQQEQDATQAQNLKPAVSRHIAQAVGSASEEPSSNLSNR